MKKTKKFLSILLAIVLILSMVPMSVANAANDVVTFSVQTDVKGAKVGDIVNVSVNMTENSNLATLTLALNYDDTVLKIVSASSQEKYEYEEFNSVFANNKLMYAAISALPQSVEGTLFTVQFEVIKDGCTEISILIDEFIDADFNTLPSATQSAKIHYYGIEIIPAVCTQDGYTVYTCECGDTYTETIPALGHNIIVDNAVSPDCVNTGLTEGSHCSRCDIMTIKQEVISALGHNIIVDNAVSPDCVNTGLTEGSHCSRCDKMTVKQEVLPALGHSYNSVVTPPTCTENGYTTYTCSVCNDSYISDKVELLGHTTVVSEKKDPDCVNTGLSAGASCTVCGEVFIEQEEIPALGHKYNSVVTLPTCTEDGYTTYTCSACGDVYTDNATPALGHTPEAAVEENYVDSTCTKDGSVDMVVYCSVCDKEIERKTEIVPIKDHKYESVVTAPTCTEDGYTTFTCSVCGDTYTDNKVSALQHSYNEEITKIPTHTENGEKTYTCETCGDTYSEKIEANGDHNHVAKITKAPTCTDEGVMTYTCVCGDEYQKEIPAYGHKYETVVTPPICTEEGFTTYTCTACDDSYVGDKTPANGHDYNAVVTPPTCTEEGFTTYTCTACEDSYVDDKTSANGHDYNAVVTVPTCTEDGFTTHTCIACGDSYVDSKTDATGHSYNAVVTAPTCTEKGYTTHTCLACKDSYVDSETDVIQHDFNWTTIEEATCTKEGVLVGKCSVCKEISFDYNEATGHNYKPVVTPPTCTEDGFTTYTCTVCDDTYVDNKISANGHDYNAVVTSPTCTEDGFTTYTCTVCDDTYVDDKVTALGHSFSSGNCTVCGEEDPDYYVFSIKQPTQTKIRNKDGIILHAEFEGNAPADSYVVWTSDNNNFGKTVMDDGVSLKVIANNKGDTVFTATLYDADGNELASDSVSLYSDSGFFQKIGGFFRSLFKATKILPY